MTWVLRCERDDLSILHAVTASSLPRAIWTLPVLRSVIQFHLEARFLRLQACVLAMAIAYSAFCRRVISRTFVSMSFSTCAREELGDILRSSPTVRLV